ncbi:MAG: NusA-like transcription termination signal-binding factor [Candidatus Woesearchaeota archaeon]
MKTIKFDQQTMQRIAMFEKMTRAHVKDCFEDMFSVLTFVVQDGDIYKALGRKAVNVQKLKNTFNKQLRIVEYKPDVKDFLVNLAKPNSLIDVKEQQNDSGVIYTMVCNDLKTRGYLIGRNAQTLRNNEMIAKKYFDIQELKIELVQGEN